MGVIIVEGIVEQMKLVAIDEFAETLGGISWDAMRELGELALYNCKDVREATQCIQDAEVVFTSNFPLTAEMIAMAGKLRMIQVMGTGYNQVDTKAAEARGVAVCNVPDYSAVTVAQQTFALLLELCNRTGELRENIAAHGWKRGADGVVVSYLAELWGKTFGVVGLGSIGRKVAAIAAAFGMRVVYSGRSGAKPDAPYAWLPLEDLIAQSDVLSLHCPLDDDTCGMANDAFFAAMKPTAFFLNTGRGGLVDEAALTRALQSGQIAGAGLDVTNPEPPAQDNPLLTLRNCVLSPHMGAATREARQRLMDEAVENVAAFVRGEQRNRVK